MKIPSRDNYAEITEVCNLFGLTDPTEILPELENQLELVPDSMATLDDIVSGIEDARSTLSGGAADISWEGSVSEAFSTKLDFNLDTLDNLTSTLLELLEGFDITPEEVKKFITTFLKWLAALIVLAIAILALIAAAIVVGGGSAPGIGLAVAILGFILAILGIIALINSDFPSFSEAIAEIINGIVDWLESLCEDERGKLEGPGKGDGHCPQC